MSIAESKREKIGAIVNGNEFVIPSYQRKYEIITEFIIQECNSRI